MAIEDLLSSGRGLIILVVVVAIVLLVAGSTLTSIRELESKLPGEGLNVTLSLKTIKCSQGVAAGFTPGTHTLDIELLHKLSDADKRSMKIATILTVGKTTWWPWGKTDPPERPHFDMVDGEAEYVYRTAMPVDSKPGDPVFISVSLWQFSGDFRADCLVNGFQLHGPGFVFGGPIDTGQEKDDFSNLIGGSSVDESFKGCATQFLVSKQVSAPVTCP